MQDHPDAPTTLLKDTGWPTPGADRAATARQPMGIILVLVALVLLGDVLFWARTPGLSLALFAVAIFVADVVAARAAPAYRTSSPEAASSSPRPDGTGSAGSRALRQVQPGAVAVLILAVLPVVEHVQPLSVLILVLGLPVSMALNRRRAPLPALVALVRRLPLALMQDLIAGLRRLPAMPARQVARNWAFPLGGLLVLVSLLSQANPVLADWITALMRLPPDPADLIRRALFWFGLALILWPLITPTPDSSLRIGPVAMPRLGLNAASVANALIVFNLMLALQTGLDLIYLYGGTTPPGMSLATYAQRGAYPLLATALLAGAFALAARPWVAERPALKPLLLLWLVQNVLLTLSALYRLDLYVDSFGLTYLRVHAAIWMALVAAGLALTLTQIAAGKSNAWLLIRCTVLGLGTLYLCAFVNFAAIIARVNVAEDRIDLYYLCALGPTAAAEIPADLTWTSQDSICSFQTPQITGWRDWGFRNWRVRRYLDRQLPEPPLEDPRRG